MLRHFLIVLTIICLFLAQKKSETQNRGDKTEKKLTIDAPNHATRITQLTPEFIEENNINKWIQFKKFKDAMEDISQLNPAKYHDFISELYKTTSSLLKSPFPDNLINSQSTAELKWYKPKLSNVIFMHQINKILN